MSPGKNVSLHSTIAQRAQIARRARIALLAGPLSLAACMTDAPLGTAEQAAITPLPTDLDLTLNARTSVLIGSLSNVNGDVTKLILADGARLEPSEPVVLLVSGASASAPAPSSAPTPGRSAP